MRIYPNFITWCFTFVIFFAASNAEACSSGCGLITNGLSADVRQLMEKGRAQGKNPISCIRTQACQDRLRRCYERIGQVGRAARKSAHSDGKACDYSPGHRGSLRSIKNKMGLRNINDLIHRNGHGGGLHVYTSRFTGSRVAEKPDRPSKPNKPDTPPEREPANEGGHKQLANGKYKCPSGMQSICGSTKDTRWCQHWIRTGNTPGCHSY